MTKRRLLCHQCYDAMNPLFILRYSMRGERMSIADNYLRVSEELAAACVEVARDPDDVCLLAVSKTVGVDGVRDAIEAGAVDFGENRPDLLIDKAEEFPDRRWHFIGNIQSRRIEDIVRFSTLIHSLYQEKHAIKIDRCAEKMGKVQDVLIEVNVSGEKSKSGIAPDEAALLLERCEALCNIRVRGLMTMAPQGDLEVARRTFADLRKLAEHLRATLNGEDAKAFDQLSMGMSEDWKVAVAEGSTIVRIGRAVFSENFA